jgi:2-polyprenyl-3-methyl-5-hydroxy-6-metoxy-1,4-benzoquinol methylase
VQGSAYDLSTLCKQKFDVILFFGVWYHLKNPVRAFEEVATMLEDGGTCAAKERP